MYRRMRKKTAVLCISLLMALTIAPFGALAGPPKFQSATLTYPLSGTALDIAFADISGDGIQDAVIVDTPGNAVEVRIGNGDGTFQTAPTPERYATGMSPRSIAVADYNGDGALDVAVTNYGSHNVSVMLGGTGILLPRADYTTGPGSGPSEIAAVDLDGDGHTDLAIAANDSNALVVLYGNGDGTFEAPVLFHVPPGSWPSYIEIADFDNNLWPDVAVAHDGGTGISILLNDGTGRTVQFASNTVVGGEVTGAAGIVSGDFDNDGNADLAAANNGDAGVAVLLGNGDGSFQTAALYAGVSLPQEIEMGDFDGDGYLDLAVSNIGGSDMLSGDGDGSFSLESTYIGGYLSRGDLNHDGLPDLAIHGSSLHLWMSRAEGVLSLNAPAYSVAENAGNAVVTVNRTGSSYGQTKLRIQTANGSAVAGTDYTAVDDTIVFDPGDTAATYAIPINDNAVRTLDRTFIVTISAPTNEASLGAETSATVTIQEDDAVPDTAAPFIDLSKFAAEDHYSGTADRLTGAAGAISEAGAAVKAYPWDDADSNGAVDSGELGFPPIGLGTSGADGSVAAADIGDLAPGAYAYVITATDAAGNESPRSAAEALTIQLTKTAMTNADLSSLGMTDAALNAPFAAATTAYTANVGNDVASIRVTPASADGGATAEVRVNGGAYTTVASGTPSGALTLRVGANAIDVRVTAPDAATTKIYTITVTRAASAGSSAPILSGNNDLRTLAVKDTNGQEIPITPSFEKAVTQYAAHTESEQVEIRPAADSSFAAITWDGQTVTGAIPVALEEGENTIRLSVQAENGAIKTYTLTVSRSQLPAIPEPVPCAFTDIKGHWAERQICEAAAKGIIEGDSVTIFRPGGLVTRAEFAVMLMRTLGGPPGSFTRELPFADSSEIPAWADDAVSAAVERGILGGYSDGTLRPQQTISRAEMAAMLGKAMRWEPSGTRPAFADDADLPVWATGFIHSAVQQGVLAGRTDNRFDPDARTTRTEAASVLLRLLHGKDRL